mmetsp:Transcript_21907/g.37392  ORF Transcript_21907/g.37392 Transcript_21907/m.37392 type:complete len:258 (+) Transcript_21907:1161-1934(+)
MQVAQDAQAQLLLQIVAGELVRPVVLARVAAVEQGGRHVSPPLAECPPDQVLDRLLASVDDSRRRLVVVPPHLLLDGASPEVLPGRFSVPRGLLFAGVLGPQADAQRKVVLLEHHGHGPVADRPQVLVAEADRELAHPHLLDALGVTVQPFHPVFDLDLLVHKVVEVVEPRPLAQVEGGPDRVAHVLGLQVNNDVVQLPLGRGEDDLLRPKLLHVVLHVDEGDGGARVRVLCVHLFGSRPERQVQQSFAATLRHVAG